MKFNIIEAVNNYKMEWLKEYYDGRCDEAKYLSKQEFLKRTILSIFVEDYMCEHYPLEHSEEDWCIFDTEYAPRKHAPDLVSYDNRYFDVKVVNNNSCVKYLDWSKYTAFVDGLIVYNLKDKSLNLVNSDSSVVVLCDNLDIEKIYRNISYVFILIDKNF